MRCPSPRDARSVARAPIRTPTARRSRAQEGFDAQERKLSEAQDKVRLSEERIRQLQAELRRLAADVQAKESQVETDASALATLRHRHDELMCKNQSITEREQREAAQREEIREAYVDHLREGAKELHSRWRALTGSAEHAAEGTIIDELVQLSGELEASIDTLASQPDARAMLSVGFGQQVFACLSKVGGELHARLAASGAELWSAAFFESVAQAAQPTDECAPAESDAATAGEEAEREAGERRGKRGAAEAPSMQADAPDADGRDERAEPGKRRRPSPRSDE